MQEIDLDLAEEKWLAGEIDAETYFQIVFRTATEVGQRELDKALHKGRPLAAA